MLLKKWPLLSEISLGEQKSIQPLEFSKKFSHINFMPFSHLPLQHESPGYKPLSPLHCLFCPNKKLIVSFPRGTIQPAFYILGYLKIKYKFRPLTILLQNLSLFYFSQSAMYILMSDRFISAFHTSVISTIHDIFKLHPSLLQEFSGHHAALDLYPIYSRYLSHFLSCF